MNIPIMLALATLVCGGVINFFSKVAGVNQVYTPSFMLFQTVGFGVLAIVIHLAQRHPLDLSPKMTWLGVASGALGAIGLYSLILAFRMGGEGSVLFPISGLGMLVAVTLSLVFYREPVTATKLLGMGLGMSSIIVLSR